MKALSQLLELSGKSLHQLSRETGIDVSDLSRAMRGQKQLSKFDAFLVRRTLTLAIAAKDGALDQLIHA